MISTSVHWKLELTQLYLGCHMGDSPQGWQGTADRQRIVTWRRTTHCADLGTKTPLPLENWVGISGLALQVENMCSRLLGSHNLTSIHLTTFVQWWLWGDMEWPRTNSTAPLIQPTREGLCGRPMEKGDSKSNPEDPRSSWEEWWSHQGFSWLFGQFWISEFGQTELQCD